MRDLTILQIAKHPQPHPELPTGGADQLCDKVYSPTWEQLGFLFSLLYKEPAKRASRRMATGTVEQAAILRDPRSSALLRLYVPFLAEATHPRCGCEGYPDRPGRASSKEGES